MGSDSDLAEYRRGYQHGWRSTRQAEPNHLPDTIPDGAKRSDQSAYEAGFEQGRAIAGGK
jgi:hypothetical protein